MDGEFKVAEESHKMRDCLIVLKCEQSGARFKAVSFFRFICKRFLISNFTNSPAGPPICCCGAHLESNKKISRRDRGLRHSTTRNH